jgi:Fic family protein
MPLTPPTAEAVLGRLSPGRLRRLLGYGQPAVDGEYLHWDSLRHRTPPDDLRPEEWWMAIRFARMSAAEPMPLFDKQGRPFSLVYVPRVRRGLHRIDQSFGAPGEASQVSSDVRDMVDAHGPRYLLSSSFMEEAIRSSQLEGASTTRARARDMIRNRQKPTNRSERMVLNNFHAMERVEDLANEPLTAEAVFELQRILVEGTLDDPTRSGAFREVEDNIVVELLHSTETAHVPPPAGELPERLERLVAFANGETPEDWLHPVLRAIIVHFMIGYDHPFVDGNGRVARTLFYWAMLRYGYAYAKHLSISHVLRRAPAKYARAYLHTKTDSGDLTYFVDHQIGVILTSIESLSKYVQSKVADTREVEERLRDSSELNHRQIRLLGHALRNPGFKYTVRSHENSHRVATNTARADLVDLVDKNLLIRSREGRRHVFLAPRDLAERIRDR